MELKFFLQNFEKVKGLKNEITIYCILKIQGVTVVFLSSIQKLKSSYGSISILFQ